MRQKNNGLSGNISGFLGEVTKEMTVRLRPRSPDMSWYFRAPLPIFRNTRNCNATPPIGRDYYFLIIVWFRNKNTYLYRPTVKWGSFVIFLYVRCSTKNKKGHVDVSPTLRFLQFVLTVVYV